METVWIKNPLAIYTGTTQDAGGGIVVQGSRIVELIASNQEPTTTITAVIDASQHVITPGL